MHRIDSANARPDANGAGKAGYHLNTDLSGVDPTHLDPIALNALQEELCTVIETAAIGLVKGTNNQLLAALQALFAAISGNANKTFEVETATADTHAATFKQLNDGLGGKAATNGGSANVFSVGTATAEEHAPRLKQLIDGLAEKANLNGDTAQKFKALAGTEADDVVVMGQLPVKIVAAGVITMSKTYLQNDRAILSFTGHNLAGVTFSDAVREASIAIDFDNDEPDANYIVVANVTGGQLAGQGISCEPHTKTTAGFQIASFSGGGNEPRPTWWADYAAGWTSSVNLVVYRV